LLEELGLDTSFLVADVLFGARPEERAHPGIGRCRNDVGGRDDLLLVEATVNIGLDLAHVPGHEAVAGLADLDHVLRFHGLLGQ